jgi:hypothetical protein
MKTLVKDNLIVTLSIAILIQFAFNCGEQKKETNEITEVEGVVIDTSPKTLFAPQHVKDSIDCIIADQPATIHFSVVEGCYPLPDDNRGVWSSWSQTLYASDGNFYSAISNHQGVDGRTYVIRYEPKTGNQTRVFDSYEVFNHIPGTYGHGKIHGQLDEYPKGKIVGLTYWGMPPLVTEYKGERWLGSVPGGRLFEIDIKSGTARDMGTPFARDSWPAFATDTKRGILFAHGFDKHFLAYDLNENEVLYAALPPATIELSPRTVIADRVTGCSYSTNLERFVKFDPQTKQFIHLAVSAPKNPNRKDMSKFTPGRNDNSFYLRCATRNRNKEGAYICQTMTGMMFKFYPDQEKIEVLGTNWDKGLYCTSVALSPGERYFYYTVGAHGSSYKYGCPVVQYDLKMKTKKVIAFLHPYYSDKYGYVFGGSYGVSLNEDGSQLFIAWNGKFTPEKQGESFGDPTCMLIEIPESERME